MIQALSVTLPTLDTSIGSPIRSVLDAVAEVQSEQTADQYLLQYQYDVYSMSGTNLDAFCNIFGIYRYAAKRATGYITFSRATPAQQDILIAAGAQLSDGSSPPNTFTTIIPAVMPTGTSSVTVPVQASIAGVQGNVAANTVTIPVSPFPGISIYTNLNGMTGGANAESDQALQTRFVTTVLRQLTGTSDMYRASALEDPSVTQANVIGATETNVEQIQLINGVGVSSVQDLAFLYNNNTYFGIDLAGGQLFSPGVQYTVNFDFFANPIAPTDGGTLGGGGAIPTTTPVYAMTIVTIAGETALGDPLSVTVASGDREVLTWSAPGLSYDADILSYNLFRNDGSEFQLIASLNNATFTYTDAGSVIGGEAPIINTTGTPIVRSLDAINVPDGIYQLQFDYLSTASRNDPANNITNRIDIYVNGQRPIEAIQDIVYTDGFVFNDTDPTDIENITISRNIQLFERIDGTQPEAGNYFTPFAFAPVIDMLDNSNGIPLSPQVIGGTTWIEGSNYWVVNDVSQFGGAASSRSGIEWANPGPTNLTPIRVHYEYNQVPTSVQQNVEGWRLVTTDCQVHQANQLNLDMYFAVILQGTQSAANILPSIEAAISNYVTSIRFKGVIQVSALLAAVQGVSGVRAVRFLTSADGMRTDTVSYTTSSTIPDTSITDADFGSPVRDSITGYIPDDSFVGEVTAGASFVLVNSEGDAVNPTGSGSSIEIGTPLTLFGTGPHNGDYALGYYAIQSVDPTDTPLVTYATTLGSPLRAVDVYLNDSTLAALNNVYIIPMAQNTFGAV